jgi:hypothetical protein
MAYLLPAHFKNGFIAYLSTKTLPCLTHHNIFLQFREAPLAEDFSGGGVESFQKA